MVKRNKPLITASVSPYIKEQADALVDSGNFGSMSDLVSIALAEFIGNYKREHGMTAHKSPLTTSKDDKPIVVEHIIE
ncbi:hypothetical protein [Methanolobus sp.]|jgi:Arc/MetJ-type ribon-helix-helix transcriptional regulator|uniref:hypothetical protein n=1 Tax=Methanolobus sp. TaxID=1874737 RepID=UPI0025FF7AC7|nr:hypothetical protein [Methanolobus sp.]